MAVALRPVADGDRPFLVRLFASTRGEELAHLAGDAAMAEAFLDLQFDLQDRSYRSRCPDASFELVLLDGAPAGRLTVERRAEEIHVLDIALLPEHRGRGLGSALLGELLDEGRRTGRPVTVNALRGGRALALYQRLGFALSGGDEVYADLTWRPPQLKTAS